MKINRVSKIVMTPHYVLLFFDWLIIIIYSLSMHDE